jgi:peptidoglycan/LPS O-acetylase OafA/YrhL
VFLFHGEHFDLGLPRWLRAGVPAALLIYGLAAVPLPSSSWLELGGRASYVLYLSHTMILGATAAVLGKALQVDVWNNGYWFALPILASLIFALLFNILIETRIQAWRQRQKKAKQLAEG